MNQRLDQQSAQQVTHDVQVQAQRRNFEEAEEVIRADREQTEVPKALTGKLAGTLSAEPSAPHKSWWQRIFK